VLLDEPTANLDPAGADLVRSALAAALRDRGATLVMVEHRVAEALPLIDRVVVLTPGGGVVADGPPARVFAAHGTALAEAGVWMPGLPVTPRHAVTAAGEVLLTTEALGYRHPGADRAALSDVDTMVRAGQALAVTGPNGAGKSTFALLAGGLLGPTSGRVVATPALAGDAAGRPPHRWRAAALTGRIGSVFQNPEHQFVTAKVRDELALGPRRTGRGESDIESTVDELLTRLRLDRLAQANPYTLSGGEQRRLSVATALATAPRLLVLDEPTFGQDRRTWLELVDLLARLRDDGRAIVAVTHDADFVAALADVRLELHSGRVTVTSRSGLAR
jgi:energy-coupling factor transport system ATP-binding protein